MKSFWSTFKESKTNKFFQRLDSLADAAHDEKITL